MSPKRSIEIIWWARNCNVIDTTEFVIYSILVSLLSYMFYFNVMNIGFAKTYYFCNFQGTDYKKIQQSG